MNFSKGLCVAVLLGMPLIACNESQPADSAAHSSAHGGDQHGKDGHGDHGHEHAPPQGKVEKGQVFFVFPQAGSTVHEQFDMAFGVRDLEVVPAGQDMDNPKKGHHHIVVDGKSVPQGTVVPADETHIHYGGGQTQAALKLAPGKHTLTLQFADGAHRSYGEKLSTTIPIEVVAGPAKKSVFFESPKNGAEVKNPVKLKFGVEGMAIRPAGEAPLDKTSGHHHIVVDGGPIPLGSVVPKNETNIHYGGGQTEAELKLAPGKHKLTMQLADGAHLSYGDALSQTIEITVVE